MHTQKLSKNCQKNKCDWSWPSWKGNFGLQSFKSFFLLFFKYWKNDYIEKQVLVVCKSKYPKAFFCASLELVNNERGTREKTFSEDSRNFVFRIILNFEIS